MSEVAPVPEAGVTATMTPALTLMFAVATGAIVANLYYAQPLLGQLARELHVQAATAALLVTATQAGYAVGLALIVPLGDVLDRRSLVFTLLGLAVLALLLAALSPGFPVFALASVLIGVSSVSAQVLVPFAATLASPERRGQVVGTVMSGLLLGILLARTVSGLLSEVWGWRSVYFVAAALLTLLGLLLRPVLPGKVSPGRVLPQGGLPAPLDYGTLLRSVLELLRTEPLLRRRSWLGALGFAAFSVFWTTVSFLLSEPPYHLSQAQIGLFGLAGAAGALAASWAGRWADAGYARRSTTAFAALTCASFLPLALGAHSLWWLLAGVLLLDLGVQGLHVTNQSEVYRLRPDARSRVTTVYLTSYFLGGAAGSAAASALYAAGGWPAVCGLGAVLGLVALLSGSGRAAR